MKWTLIQLFHPTLTLAHLERSLYSLSRQTVKPNEMIFFDNNSRESEDSLREVLSIHFKLEQWRTCFAKHRDIRKTLSWGANNSIRMATHPVFVFARADFIFDFTFCEKLLREIGDNPMTFSCGWMYMMPYYTDELSPGWSHATDLEPLAWRDDPQRLLKNNRDVEGYHMECWKGAHLEAPTYCTTKQAMDAAGWYDETVYGWGYDQQDLQSYMVRNGVRMKVVPEWLYFHMMHRAPRDGGLAMRVWSGSPKRGPEIKAELERLNRIKEHKS